MYIKKSVLEGIVLGIGSIVLVGLIIVFGFTEIEISTVACMVLWMGCIAAMKGIVAKIQRYGV
ncbi:MAG: hypothetical protein PHN80_06660 [Hespellia sp.]|nr:hypothetical protein [Hespellia sp.]